MRQFVYKTMLNPWAIVLEQCTLALSVIMVIRA